MGKQSALRTLESVLEEDDASLESPKNAKGDEINIKINVPADLNFGTEDRKQGFGKVIPKNIDQDNFEVKIQPYISQAARPDQKIMD